MIIWTIEMPGGWREMGMCLESCYMPRVALLGALGAAMTHDRQRPGSKSGSVSSTMVVLDR